MPARDWQCYYDTGGTQSAIDGTVLVTVGVVATSEKWARFDRRWLAALRDEGVRDCHMKEFAQSKGQYVNWAGDEARRAAFLRRLTHEAKRGINKAFVVILELAAYREADKRYRLSETVGGAYALTQAGCIGRTFEWLQERSRPSDRAGFLVEKGDAGQGAFMAFMKRDRHIQPDIVARFDDKGEPITPFQVADLIAYEFRRAIERRLAGGKTSPLRSSFTGILRMLPLDHAVMGQEMIEAFCAARVPLR
jgi:hypothetical protein